LNFSLKTQRHYTQCKTKAQQLLPSLSSNNNAINKLKNNNKSLLGLPKSNKLKLPCLPEKLIWKSYWLKAMAVKGRTKTLKTINNLQTGLMLPST
jgi:hypothetical protein